MEKHRDCRECGTSEADCHAHIKKRLSAQGEDTGGMNSFSPACCPDCKHEY